jgi:asparagine synthase (glutamine-hydrolysing)
MPGIAGIIRKSRYDGIARDLELMVAAMRHDLQSTSGTYVDEALGLGVGWVSHRDSYADCMPLVAQDANVVIVFQGEHFSSPAQLTRLGETASGARSRNALQLLAMYEVYGPNFYVELNGWFSGIVLDRRRNIATLFNDRYAMGRIYYHESDDEFVFASEAKSLLRVRPRLKRLCEETLAEHLRYNCVLNNRTLFSGIRLLPHASAWSFENGTLSQRRQYFEFGEWERQPELDPDEFFRQWAQTVSDTFPRYADEGERVALSMTAGLDTRLILASLRERNREHPVYTFGGPWGELYDVSTARRAAGVYGQRFELIQITDAFLKNFGDLATRAIWISDGCHDAFGAHDVFFNEAACRIAPIRLTGKFGSEVVRIRRLLGTVGYQRGVLRDHLQTMVERLPQFEKINPQGNHLTRVVTEEISWHEYGRVVVEQAFLTMRTPYMDNALVKLMYQAPKGSRAAGDLQERYVKEFAPEFATFITNLGRFASRSHLLTKLAYYPFWALFKVEYIYLMATPHWMTRLDHRLRGLHLERLLSGRQKWEAYRIWIRTHFSEFIQDALLNPSAEYTAHFDYSTISRMVREHVRGSHNHLLAINRALSVQLIYSALLKP